METRVQLFADLLRQFIPYTSSNGNYNKMYQLKYWYWKLCHIICYTSTREVQILCALLKTIDQTNLAN